MTGTARNRLLLVGALVVAAGALGFVALGNMGQNLVYYWSPKEMVAQGDRAYGATIRLGGLVQPGSLHWDAGHTELTFRVASDKAAGAPSVLIRAHETPPQMFREGIGVVVEGTFARDQVFTANRLMVNHSNEYRPPKAGEGDRWKETVAAPTTASAKP